MDISSGLGFSGWHALNDTVMGGRSQGQCQVGPSGLVFDGVVVSEGGGFVSCRSPLFSPPLDLSAFEGLAIDLVGEGRRFKLAVACSDGFAGIANLIPGGLRWVMEFATNAEGMTTIQVPFVSLRPSIRAKPVGVPLAFKSRAVTRLQLLHSKFDDDGGLNGGFRPGPIHLELRRICAYS
jgi:hypothetical protein